MQKTYCHQLRHFALTLVLVPAAHLRKASQREVPGPRDGITQIEPNRFYSTGVELVPEVSMLAT